MDKIRGWLCDPYDKELERREFAKREELKTPVLSTTFTLIDATEERYTLARTPSSAYLTYSDSFSMSRGEAEQVVRELTQRMQQADRMKAVR